ncbi:hypothetical protein ACYUJ6_03530 [Clostridium sp. JNZ X4-2]
MKSIITDIKYSSNNITNSSDELAAFSEEVSVTAEEITGSIQSSKKNSQVQNEEVSCAKESLDNLSKKIALINEAIDNLRNSSKITSELTVSGKQYLVSLNESTNNIGSSSKNINIKIGKLHDKSFTQISTAAEDQSSSEEQLANIA